MILFFTSKIGETDPLDRKETLEIDFDRLPFNKLIRYLRKKYMNNFFSQLIDNKNAVKNSRVLKIYLKRKKSDGIEKRNSSYISLHCSKRSCRKMDEAGARRGGGEGYSNKLIR